LSSLLKPEDASFSANTVSLESASQALALCFWSNSSCDVKPAGSGRSVLAGCHRAWSYANYGGSLHLSTVQAALKSSEGFSACTTLLSELGQQAALAWWVHACRIYRNTQPWPLVAATTATVQQWDHTARGFSPGIRCDDCNDTDSVSSDGL